MVHNKKNYQIGNCQIELLIEEGINTPANLDLFQSPNSANPDASYYIELNDNLPALIESLYPSLQTGQTIQRKTACIIALTDSDGTYRECRILNFEGDNYPYAVSFEEAPGHFHIWFDTAVNSMLIYDTIFLSALSLERLMLQKEQLILHCAYICYSAENDNHDNTDKEAILFSAPSGTGKSTQASLWERYRSARQVNGDKALLIRHENGWYAHGWPVCGSSGICHNEAHKIKSIILIHQSPDNKAYPMKGAALFKELFPEITMNMWNSEYQFKAMELLEQLICEISCIHLDCTISEEAVDCLDQCIKATC